MSTLKDVHDLFHTVMLTWDLLVSRGFKLSQNDVEMEFAKVTSTYIREAEITNNESGFVPDPATALLTPRSERLFAALKAKFEADAPYLFGPTN